MVLVFRISGGSVFHNLGADKEKARSAVLLSALEIVFSTNKEILFRERRPGREGTWRRISSDRYVGALSWTHLKVRVRSLYSILAWTGNQWSSFRIGVM